jgi:hypothetical protein
MAFERHFAGLEDPRCTGKIEHLLIDILVIAVCAVVAGAESWVDSRVIGTISPYDLAANETRDVELPREALTTLLYELTSNSAVRYTLDDDGTGVEVRFKSGEHRRYNVVLGADGLQPAASLAPQWQCLQNGGQQRAGGAQLAASSKLRTIATRGLLP